MAVSFLAIFLQWANRVHFALGTVTEHLSKPVILRGSATAM